jgi:hypothetical protein
MTDPTHCDWQVLTLVRDARALRYPVGLPRGQVVEGTFVPPERHGMWTAAPCGATADAEVRTRVLDAENFDCAYGQ